MPNFFSSKFKNSVAGGAMIIAFFSVFSRLLGLMRDRLLASAFGAGDILDCYYAAFRLPDLVFNTLVLGVLTVSFVPVFLEYWQKNKEEAWKVTNSILNIILVSLVAVGVIFFVFASKLVPIIIAPGFSPEKQMLTVRLTRIMLVGIIFLGASNVASSILNSFKRFLAFSVAPVVYNLGIIFGILFLVPVPRLGTTGLALGVVIGTALHLLVQVPSLIKIGYRWKGVFNFRHSGVRKMGLLMLPRTFGLAISQINQTVISVIASTLASGSLAIFNLANNLQHFPIGIFGISLAIASFPYLSESATKKEMNKFVDHFSVTLRRILFLIIPTSVLMIMLRAQIVRIVLGAGAFTWEDTVLTLQSLGFFAISLFACALIPLLARSFYALQDTKTPVLISLVSLAINVFLGIFLGRRIGVPGLTLAFSIASVVNVALLFAVLRVRIGYLDDKKIIKSLAKISLASAASAIIIQWAKVLTASFVNMQTFAGIFIQLALASAAGIASYLLLAFLFKCEETEVVRKALFGFFNNGKSQGVLPGSDLQDQG